MNATAHSILPEVLMAFNDGELDAKEAATVELHLKECAECQELILAFRSTSNRLAAWCVEPAPVSINETVDKSLRSQAPDRPIRFKVPLKAKPWWAWPKLGAALAVCGLFLVGVYFERVETRSSQMMAFMKPVEKKSADEALKAVATRERAKDDLSSATRSAANTEYEDAPASPPPPPVPVSPGLVAGTEPSPTPLKGKAAGGVANSFAAPTGPMIARSVAISLEVKDCATARSALDAILTRHHGYAAKLTLLTPTGAPAEFSASLRIPVQELGGTLAEVRATGRVLQETQSGEEVTAQHTDLAARLRNARETEDRLRRLLATHTGRIDDLLQVEQQMDETRGQIESMEAELQQLEHRVDFATVDLDCTEQYREQLGTGQSATAGTRIRNAFVVGLRHANASILNVLLIMEEFGPAILVWILLLGFPAFFFVRRYRRIRAGF